MITKVVTSGEMRDIDRIAIEENGIPAEVLMNNAGKSIAEFIIKKFVDKKVTIFCGTGNNGGDGFTAAYYLANSGIKTEIFLSGSKDRISATSRVFMNICEKQNIPINSIYQENDSEISIPDNHIIVDAILGTGSNGDPNGIPLRLIKIINQSLCKVISIDIPSGLSSDGDTPSSECVHADYTIAIGLPKIAHVTYPGKLYCGELIILDIGFPSDLTSAGNLKVRLFDDCHFKALNLNNSSQEIHKGDRGHTLLIGGFENMEGAAILTASALFNTGCGLLTIATTSESRQIIAGMIPEAMSISLPENSDSESLKKILTSKKISSIIIGPGLGRSLFSENVFYGTIDAIKNSGVKKIIIDGDGLFYLAEYLTAKKLPRNIEFIITPHFMEASRILNKSIDVIKHNRLKSCIELSLYSGCVTVLKGPASIISDGRISYINTTGNNSLATAGSGDVLSGIIGSFININISSAEAAAAGVFIHGYCADLYKENSASRTMSASDILKLIRPALTQKSSYRK